MDAMSTRTIPYHPFMSAKLVRLAFSEIALRLAIVLSVAGLAAWVGGCGSFASPTAERMSFAQMQALNPGVSGDWVLYEHPYARDVVRDPGTRSVRRLSYWVDDPRGDSRPLMLHFDDRGVLARKEYGGPIIRPPQPDENDFSIGG